MRWLVLWFILFSSPASCRTLLHVHWPERCHKGLLIRGQGLHLIFAQGQVIPDRHESLVRQEPPGPASALRPGRRSATGPRLRAESAGPALVSKQPPVRQLRVSPFRATGHSQRPQPLLLRTLSLLPPPQPPAGACAHPEYWREAQTCEPIHSRLAACSQRRTFSAKMFY